MINREFNIKINIIYHFGFILIAFIGLILSLYIYHNNTNDYFKLLFLLPLVFSVLNYLIYYKTVTSKSVFLITLYVILFARYNIMPFNMVAKQEYYGVGYIMPSHNSINLGIVLMLLELLIVCICILIFYRKANWKQTSVITNNNLYNNIPFIENYNILLIFIIFTFGLALLFPQSFKTISIFNNINRENSNLIVNLVSYFIIYSKVIIYFFLLRFLFAKYKNKKNFKYILLIIIISILNIAIFRGANRKRIVMNAFASLYIMMYLFPKYKRILITIFTSFIFVFIIVITVARYNIINSSINIISNFFTQQFLSGPYNMAMGIETFETYGSTNFVYDFFRPIIGIGSIIEKYFGASNYLSSEIFNMRISLGGATRTDQIVPISIQGLLNFGPMLFYLYIIIIVYIASIIDKLVHKTNKIEIKYLFVLLLMILGQLFAINFIIILNYISFEFLIIYILFKLSSKKKNSIRGM